MFVAQVQLQVSQSHEDAGVSRRGHPVPATPARSTPPRDPDRRTARHTSPGPPPLVDDPVPDVHGPAQACDMRCPTAGCDDHRARPRTAQTASHPASRPRPPAGQLIQAVKHVGLRRLRNDRIRVRPDAGGGNGDLLPTPTPRRNPKGHHGACGPVGPQALASAGVGPAICRDRTRPGCSRTGRCCATPFGMPMSGGPEIANAVPVEVYG